MEALAIVVGFDVVKDLRLSVLDTLKDAIFEHLGLERAKARFHKRVIVAIALATHALP